MYYQCCCCCCCCCCCSLFLIQISSKAGDRCGLLVWCHLGNIIKGSTDIDRSPIFITIKRYKMIFFPGPNSFFCISPWRSWLALMEKSSPAWQTSTGFLNLHLGKLFLSRSSFYFQELNCLQQSYRGNLISNMCLIDKCGLLFRIRINFANYFHLTGLPSLGEV